MGRLLSKISPERWALAAAVFMAALNWLGPRHFLQAGGLAFLHFLPDAILTGAILAGRRDSRSLAAAALGGLALWDVLGLNPSPPEGGPPFISIVFQTFLRSWLALIALIHATSRRADPAASQDSGRVRGRLVPLSALAFSAFTAFALMFNASPPLMEPNLELIICPGLIILFFTPLWLAGRGHSPFNHILGLGLGLSFFMAAALLTAATGRERIIHLLIAALSLGAVMTEGALLIGCAGLALQKYKPAVPGRPGRRSLLLTGLWLALALAGLCRFSRLNLEAVPYAGPVKTMRAGYMKLEVPEDANRTIMFVRRRDPVSNPYNALLTRWQTDIDWPELNLRLYDELPFNETTLRVEEIWERGLDVDVAGLQPGRSAKLLVENGYRELAAEVCCGVLHFIAFIEPRPSGADKKAPAGSQEIFLAKVAEILNRYQWTGSGTETAPGFRTKYGLLTPGPEAALSLYAGFASPYANWHLQVYQKSPVWQDLGLYERGSPLVSEMAETILEMAETWKNLFFSDIRYAVFRRPLTAAGRAGRLRLESRAPLADYAEIEDWRFSRRESFLSGDWMPTEKEPDARRRADFRLGVTHWYEYKEKEERLSYPEVLGIWEMILSRAAWDEDSLAEES